MDSIRITYLIHTQTPNIEELASSLLLEQTVETPYGVAVQHPYVREHLMGSIERIDPTSEENEWHVTLSLPATNVLENPAQFLNVLYGNASLFEHVRLVDFELPARATHLFQGPRFGIDGIRAALGVWEQPITCSALKPVGLNVEQMAVLCRSFADGGIHLIKDDHYLTDQPFCPFRERVNACQAAIREVEDRSGIKSIYAPHLSGTPEQVRRQADQAQAAGVGAVLIAPMLIGLPVFWELVDRYLDVPIIAHPSFAGTRLPEPILMGKLFRLFGADAVIFPNYGGRFSYTRTLCLAIAGALREPLLSLKPSFPVPAGGMKVERVDELVDTFGTDTILLVGGNLLEAPEGIVRASEAFTRSVRNTYQS